MDGIVELLRELADEMERLQKVAAAPALKGNVDLPIELNGVSRALENKDGFWKSCSGCHELDEGVPTGAYSDIMKCHLGMGCSECGGIGAIWDTTDYEDMASFMADETAPQPPAPKSEGE